MTRKMKTEYSQPAAFSSVTWNGRQTPRAQPNVIAFQTSIGAVASRPAYTQATKVQCQVTVRILIIMVDLNQFKFVLQVEVPYTQTATLRHIINPRTLKDRGQTGPLDFSHNHTDRWCHVN